MKFTLNLILLSLLFSSFYFSFDPIAGSIHLENGNAIPNVIVQLSGDINQQFITGNSGEYDLSNLSDNAIYTLTPSLNENPRNGVSTFDEVILRRHILGIQLLDSPYRYIAADVNNDQSISIADILEIKRLVLNITDEFPNNTSWRFIDASYEFPNPVNPWEESFPETIFINPNNNSPIIGDFVGVKIGDLSGDVSLE